jgi:hypothetical protein
VQNLEQAPSCNFYMVKLGYALSLCIYFPNGKDVFVVWLFCEGLETIF